MDMFWNIYSKRLLSSIRNKDQLIWIWAFPLIMSTLFYFCLSAVSQSDSLESVPVGVITDTAYEENQMFSQVLEQVSSGEDAILKVTEYAQRDKADSALEKGDIDGYILIRENTPQLVVKQDGMNQTILKSFLDRYVQTEGNIRAIMEKNPGYALDLEEIMGGDTLTEEISLSSQPYSPVINFYYALMAMVCMYGGMQGLTSITYLQGNLSALGARRMMAPLGRIRVIFYDLLASATVHMMSLLFLLFYITVILKVDFGDRLPLLVLTCLAGTILGVAFGTVVSCLSKLGENMKVGILVSITMVCCFGAGMMVSGMKYIVDQNMPIISWLNPAARISDAFYCLYYFDDYQRYCQNIAVIMAMAAGMFLLSAFSLRRQNYESI